MLSTKYRLRLEFICKCIANGEEVKLDDMIWAEKLAKSHTTARDWLQKARRQSSQDIEEGSTDDFLNRSLSNLSSLPIFQSLILSGLISSARSKSP